MDGGADPRDRRGPRRRADRHHDRAPGSEDRRAGQDGRGGGRGGSPADGPARWHRPDQRLRRADPALGARAAQGGGGQVSDTTYWVIALIIGLAAALIVATLLVMLQRSVASIEKSVGGLLDVATSVAGNTSNIPQLEATAPVLAAIVDEAVVQDGYMSALTDGFGDDR